MAKSSVEEIINKISSGRFESLYYLTGKEKYFHDQIINLIISKVLPDKSSRDLNLTILYGTENTLSELLSAAVSYPMLSDKKLIIVRDFDKMKINDTASLEKYLLNQPKTTCLVLSSDEKSQSKICNLIESSAQNVNCAPIPEYKVNSWLISNCRQKDINIDPLAAEFLINQVGSNILALAQELLKVINYKNDNSHITVEDIEHVTGLSKELSVFALQKALSSRKLGLSLKISKNLIESGQNINLINAVLFSHFYKVLLVSSLKNKGYNKQQISEKMNISDFQLKNILNSSNNFKLNQIKKIINHLHDSDILAKTSADNDNAIIQKLCYNICRA